MKKKDSDGAKEASSSAIYLFFGDEYLVKTAARDFCAELTGLNGEKAALVVFDGASLDYGDLANEVSTPSLFNDCKVIYVEQTSAFTGKTNLDKLINKACETWRSGDRKGAFRNFVQLCAAADLDSASSSMKDFLPEVVFDSPLPDKDRQTLIEIAESFIAENPSIRVNQDDSLLLDLISSPLPSGITLVLTALAVDKKKKLYKAVEKTGHVRELSPVQEKFAAGLQKNYFRKLVEDFLGKHGKTIAPDALNKMYDRSGRDIRRIHSELNKVLTYIGNRNQITARDVEDLFLDFHEPMFFDFLTVLRTADAQKCLPALIDNLKIVTHPLQTLAAITSEFRKLIVVRELLFTQLRNEWRPNMTYEQFVELMKKLRSNESPITKKSKFDPLTMKDYPLYLSLKTAQNYTMEMLGQVMEHILEAEILMKSSRIGSVSPNSLMQDLVLKICDSSSRKYAPGKK